MIHLYKHLSSFHLISYFKHLKLFRLATHWCLHNTYIYKINEEKIMIYLYDVVVREYNFSSEKYK